MLKEFSRSTFLKHSENAFKEEVLLKYEGESKCKGKIHLTTLIEVTVSNFTYHFST